MCTFFFINDAGILSNGVSQLNDSHWPKQGRASDACLWGPDFRVCDE